MGFRTIDLDSKDGYMRYDKMKKTNSVRKAFEDAEDAEFKEIFPPRDIEEEKVESILFHGVVTGVSQLRVREKPEGDILYLISEKSIVKILEDHDGWYKVETAPGRLGFVMKQFIKVYSEGG